MLQPVIHSGYSCGMVTDVLSQKMLLYRENTINMFIIPYALK